MTGRIVGLDGKPILSKRWGYLIIFVSTDEAKSWTPVKPNDVPDWIQNDEILSEMVTGSIVQKDGFKEWYIAAQWNSTDSETEKVVH